MTTMPTLAQICAAAQDVVETVSGIRAAPDTPPETWLTGSVYSLCFPGTGSVTEITAGDVEGQHTLHLYVITPLRYLRTDYARMIPLGDTVPRALLNETHLSGTVLQINQIRYTFGPLEWGGQQELGWLFELDVLAGGSLT